MRLTAGTLVLWNSRQTLAAAYVLPRIARVRSLIVGNDLLISTIIAIAFDPSHA